MKNTLAALILLTQLDGGAIWVESTQVNIIRPTAGQCHGAAGSAIKVGGTALCVRETADEIRKKIKEAD